MATKTTATRTSALILATFALVGLLTTGVVSVPSAFAQTTTTTDALDDLLGGEDNGNGETDGTETETEETTTEQSGDQSETNVQSNGINQEQTAAVNNEMASGSGSEVSSDAESEAESTYKTKSKSGSTPIPGTSTSDSTATSDVSNTGTIEQEQSLSSPVQINDNTFGSDQSRSAVVGFDLGFEQFTEQAESATPDVGTRVPIVIP